MTPSSLEEKRPPTAYDILPYIRRAFPQMHPDRLAAAATLFGLAPRSPQGCRVLELGCAAGATLIPFAYYLPESEFVGVDLSARQVAEGQAFIRRLGLANIQLHALDLLDVPPAWSAFDYIICHGVYSWVAPEVQDQILTLCARHLQPHGVAYVSYNTLPGWQIPAGLRELSLLHVAGSSEPHDRLRRVRALWAQIPRDIAQLRSPVCEPLTAYLEQLTELEDAYVSHELLEVANEPLYVHQFLQRAAEHGLQLLAEIPLSQTAQFLLPERAAAEEVVFAEQYVDILVNRRFRQTLLCHAAAPVERRVKPERLTRLFLSGAVRPAGASAGPLAFETAAGDRLSVTSALAGAALEVLGRRWPAAVAWPELLEQARAVLDSPPRGFAALPSGIPEELLEFLLVGVTTGQLEVWTHAPRVSQHLPERPRLHALARAQAEANISPSTPFRGNVGLTPLTRAILLALDGQIDQAGLPDRIWTDARQGVLGEKYQVLADTSADWLRQHINHEVNRLLPSVAHNGLLDS